MDLSLFYIGIGIAIGFSVAAPIGPIGIFCIRQASSMGFLGGVITGLGASIADGVYTALAGFGASYIIEWIRHYMDWFEFLGGGFLIYIAYKISLSKVSLETEIAPTRNTLLKSCWTTMIMTFLSPMTTFLFLAMFSKFGVLNDQLTSLPILLLSVGVFLGALFWWVILSFVVNRIASIGTKFNMGFFLKQKKSFFSRGVKLLFPELKEELNLDIILIINRISSMCLFTFGVLMVIKGLGEIIRF